MQKKKHKQFNNSPNKSNLDQVLWFIENFFTAEERPRSSKKILFR